MSKSRNSAFAVTAITLALTFGNFTYQIIFTHHYAVALERSFFQFIACALMGWVLRDRP